MPKFRRGNKSETARVRAAALCVAIRLVITSKSISLWTSGAPLAYDPNRMIFSGWKVATICCVI